MCVFQTHLIVSVPEYGCSLHAGAKASCQVVVHSGGKVSEPQLFAFRQGRCRPRPHTRVYK